MEMTRIDSPAQPMRTVFTYGLYRSGKTHFAATFPRVAIFGSNREGGLETIWHMDPASFYEPNVRPQLYAVETPAEMLKHLNSDVLPQVALGKIQTVAIELSFYSDDLIRMKTDQGDNTWAKYQELEAHITQLDMRFKKIPNLRVCYNALAASADDKKMPSSVLMAGKALPRKMPALCDIVGYLRQEDKDGAHAEHVLHLTAFGSFPAGHRYGSKLPPILRNPTFRKLEDLHAGRATVDANGNVNAQLAVLPRPLLPPIGDK
jgi:hypothetical protein